MQSSFSRSPRWSSTGRIFRSASTPILCEAVCKGGAEIAVKDVPVVVAPTLWCGMAEHHMAFGGTFTFDIPTYRAVLLAFLKSIERHGFKRVFIINGHGGNIAALNAFLPDFARETALKVLSTTYFELSRGDLAPFLDDQKSVHHACEVETSMMMVVIPERVKNDRLPRPSACSGWTSTRHCADRRRNSTISRR